MTATTAEPTIDLRDAMVAALDKLIASGAIEQALEERIAKTVKECVDNALGTYSDCGKQIKAAVERSMQLSGDIDLPSYNDAILKIVRAQVEHRTNAVIEQQVADNMKDLLEPAPAEIKLSDLIAQYIEHVKDRNEFGVAYGEERQVRIEHENSSYGSGGTLKLWPTTSRGAFETRSRPADIAIHFLRDGTIFSLNFREVDAEKQMFVGHLFGFERSLFRMKAAKSKLVLDKPLHDIDTTYTTTGE